MQYEIVIERDTLWVQMVLYKKSFWRKPKKVECRVWEAPFFDLYRDSFITRYKDECEKTYNSNVIVSKTK